MCGFLLYGFIKLPDKVEFAHFVARLRLTLHQADRILIGDQIGFAHDLLVDELIFCHLLVQSFETFEESAVAESRQRRGALERQVSIACNDGQVRTWHELEFGARIAVSH